MTENQTAECAPGARLPAVAVEIVTAFVAAQQAGMTRPEFEALVTALLDEYGTLD